MFIITICDSFEKNNMKKFSLYHNFSEVSTKDVKGI